MAMLLEGACIYLQNWGFQGVNSYHNECLDIYQVSTIHVSRMSHMCQKGWIGHNNVLKRDWLSWWFVLLPAPQKWLLWDVICLDVFVSSELLILSPCDSSYGFQYHLGEYLFIANFHKINLVCKHASLTKSITHPYTIFAWFVNNPSFTKSIFLYWIFIGSLFWRNNVGYLLFATIFTNPIFAWTLKTWEPSTWPTCFPFSHVTLQKGKRVWFKVCGNGMITQNRLLGWCFQP